MKIKKTVLLLVVAFLLGAGSATALDGPKLLAYIDSLWSALDACNDVQGDLVVVLCSLDEGSCGGVRDAVATNQKLYLEARSGYRTQVRPMLVR